jgi:transcriptional regulator with XRE-family HTH domain
MAGRFGEMVRAARRSLKLTLDDLRQRSRISKPYLSQIETGHAPPPDDAKVLQLERGLHLAPGALLRAAHLERTPADVRVYIELLQEENRALRSKRLMGRQMTRFRDAGHDEADAQAAAGEQNDPMAVALGRLIPLIPRRHALGHDGVPADALAVPPEAAEDYIRCPGVGDQGAFAAAIRGNYMAEAFTDGDLVVFAPSPKPRHEADQLVQLADGTCLLRRVFEDGEAAYRLQPLNPAYAPMRIPRQQVLSCHRILATIRVHG